MTAISRVFGLIRDIVIALLFGAGTGADAFFIAFKIPNYLRRLFAEGGFSQAFVPVLSEFRSRQGQDEVQRLVNHVAGTLGLVLFVVTAIGVIAAPVLIMVFAPGFIDEPEKFDLASGMLRITFPYLFFISLTALAGGILNTYGRFGVPAFTPVLLNISLILCALYLSPHLSQPITALAWGVFIAGIAQLLFQLPFLLRLKMLPVPRPNRHYEGVKRIIRLMVPTLFAVSVSQLNLMIDMFIASFLQTGSISWLYYSDRLMEFPLGVFGVALATVILPDLSKQFAEGAVEKFSRMLDWALRWTLLISIPMLTTIFQYGEFSQRDVDMATRSLVTYGFGLSGFILVKIFASGYFSRQDTRTPVKVAVIAMFSNIILNLLLVVPLAHAGLALATSIAAYINAGLLFYYIHKRQAYLIQPGWQKFVLRLVIACLAMVMVLWYLVPDVENWMQWDAYFRAGQLLMWVITGMLTYTAGLWLTGLRPHHMAMIRQ